MIEPTNIYENINELIELCQHKIETLEQLKRALMLADLMGVKPSQLKEKVSTRVSEGHGSIRPWKDATLHITRVFSDGSEQKYQFNLIEDNVPIDLWPPHLAADYARYKGRQRAQEERRRITRKPD